MGKNRPTRSPPVSSGQLRATSWVTKSRARVMTVADTEPDWAPERANPMPMMTATTRVTNTAMRTATPGDTSTVANPKGASGMRSAFDSAEMANTAKV